MKTIKNQQVMDAQILNRLQLANQLTTAKKFYSYWFIQLTDPANKDKNKVEIFNDVNKLYMQVFKSKQPKYTSYKSFLTAVSKENALQC